CLLGHSSVEDMLDAENKRMAENLSAKVSRLKSVSLKLFAKNNTFFFKGNFVLTLCLLQLAYDIDQETEDQNDYLDGMDSNFMSATGLLTGSVKRFSTMVRSSRDNRRLLCYISIGLVVVFFILYYIVIRIQR
ncbi:hypothetical protein NQD34_004042, partial [Periophthalmus magnuspinnatus]